MEFVYGPKSQLGALKCYLRAEKGFWRDLG